MSAAICAAALAVGCAPAESERAPAPATTIAAPGTTSDRFVAFFEQRCVVPSRAGQRPDVDGLVPAGGEAIARSPGAPAYRELTSLDLAFWTAPDDTAGDVLFVVDADETSERCAAVTSAFDAAAFARTLKTAYPLYLPQDDDERVVNARIVLELAEDEERSRVYSIYHDAQNRTSALVLTLAEADG